MIDPLSPNVVLTTAPQPGAVALLELHGPGASAVLERLTGRGDWRQGRLHLVNLADVDQGLAVLLSREWAQIMAHGGPRVVQKLVDRLLELGARYDTEPNPRQTYLEASSAIEADMLAMMARAASPAAIDLLAAQPALWRQHFANAAGSQRADDASATPPGQSRGDGGADDDNRNKGGAPSMRDSRAFPETERQDLEARADVFDRLIAPASVVVVGRPNVGKSTLANAMLGRAVSVVADLPGVTRDWVAGLAEMCPQHAIPGPKGPEACGEPASHAGPPRPGSTQGVAVRWTDTPGLRPKGGDAVEQEAVRLAEQVLREAEVLIAMRDPRTDWPDRETLPRPPDLYVLNKVDEQASDTAGPPTEAGSTPDAPLRLSAVQDLGLDALEHRVIERLGLDQLNPPPLWAFSPTLRRALQNKPVDLMAYLDRDAPA